MAGPSRTPFASLLPWDETREDRLRLWIPALLLLLLALLLAIMIQLTPKVEKDRYSTQDIPDRLAQFIAEQKKEKEPPKPVEPEKPEEEVIKEPEPEPEPEPVKEPEKQPEVQEKQPEPTQQEIAQAKEAASKRVAVFEDAFAGLRDLAPDTGSMDGTSDDLQLGGDAAADIDPGRDLIAVAAGKGSSSSSFVSAGRASGQGSIAGQGDGRLAGAGQGGAIGAKVESDLAKGGAASTTTKKPSGSSGRTDEQIRRVFDRYAGRINSQYQRALRDNPTLQGTVVLNLTITPEGKVSEVTIKSSELDDDGLLMRIRVIVQSMDFGALPVETWKGTYSLNFFPS